MSIICNVLLLLPLLIVLSSLEGVTSKRRPSEDDRIREWYERNNTWPPRWQEQTLAFRINMKKREEELLLLPGAQERWENFMQHTQSQLVPRFTEKGFAVINIPTQTFQKLKNALDNGLKNWDTMALEQQIDAVYTPLPSKFIHLGPLFHEIAEDLKPLHEAWSNMELQHTSTYGIRLYQNGSSLVMHYDKVHTHVISSIVHIGHEYDDPNHPWPIEIEDHDGNLHAVNLEPGQMLFYESASCLHGRRQIFRGKHYSSVFVHYQPVDKSIWNYDIDDIIANVPPFWREGVLEDKGSRWAGQGLTTDSRVTDGAPARVINGQAAPDIKAYYRRHNPQHLQFLREHLAQHDRLIEELQASVDVERAQEYSEEPEL